MSDVNMSFPKMLFFFSFFLCTHADRKVTTGFLRSNETSHNAIAHIQAIGDKDALHYLISTIGIPTILVAQTDADATLNINWGRLNANHTEMGESITITGKVHYTYSVLFTRLIEYSDTKDVSDMTQYDWHSKAFKSHNLDSFSWKDMSNTSNAASNSVLLEASRTDDDIWLSNGTFSFRINAFGSSGREAQLPHLEYSEDIIQVDLNIDHLWTNLSMSRFAVEMIMVGGATGQMNIDESQSIDDEYTPGVFTINNWLTKPDSADGAFLQWKPVCYQSLSRARAVATAMKHYGLQPLDDYQQQMLNSTIVYGFYGNRVMNVMRTAANFSFGFSEDGGYNKTMVTTWTASVGYGTPPKDSVSMIVIIIISSGLGLPAVIIIFGGIFVCVKKRGSGSGDLKASGQNQYKPINSQ